jgi:hypothetical protein
MRYKYSVDKNNQLLIKPPRVKLPLLVSGRFKIDSDNNLNYYLNDTDFWRREYCLPPKIVFKGNWRLNKNYDLELALDKTREQHQGDILVIKGNIISSDGNVLAFEVNTIDQDGLLHAQIIKLTVTCLADEANHLIFVVKKRSPDIITLTGNWQLNQNQQITYKYEKTELKTKRKIAQSFIFEGFWQISNVNKLTYIFKNNPESKFDFRAQIETPTIYPQKGLVKYRLGLGLRQDRITRYKIISLYGAWKFSRNLGLVFEMDYGNGNIYVNQFAAEITFDRKDKLTFELRNKTGESLGFSVVFTHRFLKELDAEAFLRLTASQRESRIDAGLRIPF